MYLLLKKYYNPIDGLHYYEEMERIMNESIANIIYHSLSYDKDFCTIRVGILTNEYLDTFFGTYDDTLEIR